MKKLLFVLVFALALAGAAFFIYREGVLPMNKDDMSKQMVIIRKGQTLDSIANTLFLEKLIRNRIVFYVVVKQLGLERSLQAGNFELSPSMSTQEIALALTKGSVDVWVTIPEGMRKEEISEIIAKELPGFSTSEFLSLAEEGFLFPDTYLVPKSLDTEGVVAMLRKTYDEKAAPLIAKERSKTGLTEKEVLILASIVEREALFADDRPQIASIFLRRLNEPMRLQVDATVQYALGYDKEEKTWWKKGLTFEDLKVDSSYNTYVKDGLPLGPIANPGLAAIEAVLRADADTPYLYYVNDVNGKLHYGRTLEEHEKNIAKYITGKQ